MSRSTNDSALSNPAKLFIEWDSENGCFKTYDKNKKANIKIPLPVKFYALDELATIKGFSDKTQGGIWSNEVKNTGNQVLSVRSKGKDGKMITIAEGKYTDIKDTIAANGGKYTRSLYAAMLNDKDEYEIVNFQLKGAAFSGWLDFVNENKHSVMTAEIVCDDFKKEKKGATKYTIPQFRAEEASEEGNEAAIKLDVNLQEYLKAYIDRTQTATEYVEDGRPATEDVGDELPF